MTKHSYNTQFFEEITSEQQAYWLGFIVADGNINNHMTQLCFNQKGSDYEHLEKLVTSLNGTQKITMTIVSGYPVARLTICGKKLCSDLMEVGVFPRKSMTQKIPAIASKLRRHFWRGVMDGDGSLGHWINNAGRKYATISINGNSNIVKGFHEFLTDNGISPPAITKHYSIYKLKLSGIRKPLDVAELLYNESSVHLSRKKAIADQFLVDYTERRDIEVLRRLPRETARPSFER